MSQNLKAVAASVVLILVGAGIDHYALRNLHLENQEVAQVESPVPSEVSCEKQDELKAKLLGVSETEIREYLRTQDADEKLRQADAILARIMQIFVAEIGLRLSDSEMNSFGKLPPAVSPTPTPRPIATPPAVSKAIPPTPERRKRFLVSIQNERTEADALRAVKSMSAESMAENLKSSSPFSPQQIQILRGRFEGSLTLDDRTKPVSRVELEFNGRRDKEQLIGRSVLIIFDAEGKQRSNSTGQGSLNKTHSSFDSSLLIDAGGDIFELYYYPQLDQFVGNFYESSRGQYKRVGSVVLHRK